MIIGGTLPQNRLLRTCQIRDVTERVAREAARLRTATSRAGTIAATDAIVVAFASTLKAPVVLTSDPTDLTALADHVLQPIAVVAT